MDWRPCHTLALGAEISFLFGRETVLNARQTVRVSGACCGTALLGEKGCFTNQGCRS